MRYIKHLVALSAVLISQGCYLLEAVGGSCPQEQIVVTWPVTVTRGTSVTTQLLTSTLTPQNLDQTQFDRLRAVLTEGGAGTTGAHFVVWTVDAFNVNGGYISLTHEAPLAAGVSKPVQVAFQGGGWGAQPVVAVPQPAIALRADNFTATTASGFFTVLDSTPLRLRIDVTTGNASGETIRVAGDAGFAYQTVDAICD